MQNNYNILVEHLRQFTLKYNKNKVIKGFILGSTLLFTYFLVINLFEYFAWSAPVIRTILFYSFIFVWLFVTVYFLIIPGIKIFNLQLVLSEEQAARIIGRHFPEVEDKLLNTLQLKSQNLSSGQQELILASINQKAKSLTIIPFKEAVSFRDNITYLKYAFVPFIIITLIIVLSPSTLIQPAKRIITHNQVYEKPLPFKIILRNNDLNGFQKDDFEIVAELTGENRPSDVSIMQGPYLVKMDQTMDNQYSYTFKNLKSDIFFRFKADGFTSEEYHLKVNPKPVLLSFNIILDYPAYLNKDAIQLENISDLVVPSGTNLKFRFFTKDTDSILFISKIDTLWINNEISDAYLFDFVARENTRFSLIPVNKFIESYDSLKFNFIVINDGFPTIAVREITSNQEYGKSNFVGSISDDYGFHSLKFYHKNHDSSTNQYIANTIEFDTSIAQQAYGYYFNALEHNYTPGNLVDCYFEVRDNDAPNGFKECKSQQFSLQLPSNELLIERADRSQDLILTELANSIKQADILDNQVNEMRLKMFDKKEMDWIDKNFIQDFLSQQAELKNKLLEIKKLQSKIDNFDELIELKAEPLLTKEQEDIKEFLKETLSELQNNDIEKLQQALQDISKENLDEFLNMQEEKNRKLKEDLEKNLELYKQFNIEKNLDKNLSALNKLAQDQFNESDLNKERKQNSKDAIQKQNELQSRFDKIFNNFKKIDSLNNTLSEPYKINIDSALKNQINSESNSAIESLQKGKGRKASDSQQQSGEMMNDFAQKVLSSFQQSKSDQMGEDSELIRRLLDNLVDMSFKEEQLLYLFALTSPNDPNFINNAEKVKLIETDFEILHDSLKSLSKRQIFIQTFVLSESQSIINNLQLALSFLHEHNNGEAIKAQQYAMTSTNNLALMLSESLKQMQSAMQAAGQKGGKGSCNSPGGGKKPSIEDIMGEQKRLGDRMKNNGKQDGKDGKDGKAGNQGINGNSQELARFAEMQAEIRNQLQKIMEGLNANDPLSSQLEDIYKKMQTNEEDFFQKKFNQETLERQKNIEIRLLNSSNALMQRDKENLRESQSGKDKNDGNLIPDIEYNELKNSQEEILLTVPIELSPYYYQLYKEYYHKTQKNQHERIP